MPQPLLPDLPSIDVDKILSESDALLNNLTTHKIQDGDTIDNKRIMGYDTAESFDSKKAQRIADQYDIPFSEQQPLGEAGKEHFKQLLKDPKFQSFEDKGYGVFGRRLTENNPLAEQMISDGYAVPTDRYNGKSQELYRRAVEKETNLFGTNREAMESLRDYNLQHQAPTIKKRASETIDAFESGAVQAIGSLGDFVTDVIGYGADKLGAERLGSWLNKKFETMASTEYADKVTGYDRREANFRMAEATHQWKIGDYAGALKTAITTPEVAAESIPLMIEMLFGGGKIKAGAKGLAKLGGYLKQNAGLATVIGQETNAQAEQFEQRTGEKVDAVKLAQMAAINTVMFSLDRMTFKDVLRMKDGLKATAKALPKSSTTKILQLATQVAARAGQAMTEEGTQEYLQTWGEILNVQAGSDPESYMKIFQDPEAQRGALTGGIMGAGAGAQLNLGGQAYHGAANSAGATVDKAIDKIKAQDKLAAEEPPKQTPPEQEVPKQAPSPTESSYNPFNSLKEIDTLMEEPMDETQHAQFVGLAQTEFLKAMDYADSIREVNPKQANTIDRQVDTAWIKLQKSVEPTSSDEAAAKQDNAVAVERVFGSMKTSWTTSAETATSLLNSAHLTEDQKVSVQNYIERKTMHDKLLNLKSVNNEVMKGEGKFYIGLENFIPQITRALEFNNTEKAGRIAAKFMNFYLQRQAKAKELGDLYKTAKQTGIPQTSTKFFKANKEPYTITAGTSQKFRDMVQLEADYAAKIKEEIEHMLSPTADYHGFDPTKTYSLEEITPLVQDMLQNPNQYENSPAKEQFTQNNIANIQKIAQKLKAEADVSPAEPKAKREGETVDDGQKKTTPKTPQKNTKQTTPPQKSTPQKTTKQSVSEPEKVSDDKVDDDDDITAPDASSEPETADSKNMFLTDTVTNPQHGLNITNWFEPKKGQSLKFGSEDNFLTIDGLDADTQYMINRDFRLFKDRFIRGIAGVLSPKSITGRVLLSQSPKAIEIFEHNPMALFVKSDDDSGAIGTRYFDDEFIATIMFSSMDWLSMNGRTMLQKTAEEINKFLGRDEDHIITPYEWELLGKAGIYKNLAVHELGTAIYKNLGIKLKRDVDGKMEGRLINDLGANAFRGLEELGLGIEHSASVKQINALSPTDNGITANEDAKVKFVQVPSVDALGDTPTGAVIEHMKVYKAARKAIQDTFGLQSSFIGPTFEKPTKVAKKVQRSTLDIPPKNRKASKKQQETPWIQRIKNIKVLSKLPKEMVLAMGEYKADMDNVHEYRKPGVAGKNESLDREYEELMDFVRDNDATKPFYFIYEFWKNGRYGIKSKTLNPLSKKLHRSMIGIRSHELMIEPLSASEEQFKLAIASAFGFDVDKRRKQASLDFFNDLVQEEYIQEAIAAIDLLLNSEKALSNKELQPIFDAVKKGKEKYHTLDGLIALHSWATEGGQGTKAFKSGLTMETDAVTSGFILTLMQVPLLKNVMTWLNRGGIFKDQEYSDFGDWAENPLHTDSYQTLVVNVQEHIKNHKMLPALERLGDSLIKDGRVTKFGRNLMKSPFLTFIYGSGMGRIIEGVKEESLNTLYKQIEEAQDDTKKLKELQRTLGSMGIRENIVGEPLKRFSAKSEELYQTIIEDVYGEGIKKYLEKEFGEIVAYRKQTNRAFKVMFEAFDIKFKKAVQAKETEKGAPLSPVEMDEVVTSLHNVFPGIRPAFGSNEHEQVSVIDRRRNLDVKDEQRKTDSNFIRTLKPKQGEALGQQATTRSYEYVFQAADAAGPVVTIHYIDGSIITGPLLDFDALGVHDAVNYSLKDVVEGTRSYNRSTLRVSSHYSVALEVLKSLRASYKHLSPVERKELQAILEHQGALGKLTLKQFGQQYAEMTTRIQNARTELFSGTMRVGHASHPDTMVEYNFDDTAKGFSDVKTVVEDADQLDREAGAQAARDYMALQDPAIEKQFKKDLKAAYRNINKRENLAAQKPRNKQTNSSRRRSQNYVEIENRIVRENLSETEARDLYVKQFESQITGDVDYANLTPEEFEELVELEARDAARSFQSSQNNLDTEQFHAKFERKLTSQNITPIFEELGKLESKPASVETKSQLRDTLTALVERAIKPAEEILLQVSEDQLETSGKLLNNDMFINVSQVKPQPAVAQSAQEVYVHELLHHVLKTGIDGVYANRHVLEKMFRHAKKHITPEDFLQRDAMGNIIYTVDEQAERAAAQAMYDYVFNNTDSTTLTDGTKMSNYLHEFMVYGLSNPQLMRKLKTIPAMDKHVDPNASFWAQLLNKLTDLLDKFISKIDGTKGATSYEALYNLAQTVAGVNAKRTSWFKQVSGPVNKKLDALDKLLNETRVKVAGKVFSVAGNNPKNIVTKTLKAIRVLPSLIENPIVVEGFRRTARKIGLIEDGFFASLAREVMGDREKYGDWYALLRQSKKLIDQARVNKANTVSKQINGEFVQPPSDDEKIALNTILLEGDMEVLVGEYSIDDLVTMLRNDEQLDQAIAAHIRELKKFPDAIYYITRAEGLGHYMAYNTNKLAILNLNAHSIAQMHGSGMKPSGDTAVVEPIIDRLVSLYALKKSPKDARRITANVMMREYQTEESSSRLENGVAFMLGMHKAFKQLSLETEFNGNPTQMLKGYIREIFDTNTSIQSAPVSQRHEMEQKGYTWVKNLNRHPMDKNKTDMAIFVSKDGLITPWMKTIVSTTDRQARGTTITQSYLSDPDNPIGRFSAMLNIDAMSRANEATTRREAKGATIDPNAEYPIPLYDDHGNIVDYRYTMSKFSKVTLMGKETRADIILGRMYGSLVDKSASKQINSTVIDKLFDDYQKNYKSDPTAFIRIAANSSDTKYREIYKVLSDSMRYEAETKWGEREIYIRRELLDLVFGYRKASLANAKFLNNHTQVKHFIKLAENIWQDFIRLVKVRIVILTPDVLKDNIISNMVASLYYGIPAGYMIKKQYEALTALKEYKEKHDQLQKLQHRQAAGMPYNKSSLVRLEEDLRTNPVRDLIDEGIFQSIVEDVDVKNLNHRDKLSRKVYAVTDALSKKSQVINTGVKVGKQLYMTEDTASFQFLLKATQFSDFVARYAMYHWEVDKKGMDKKSALNKVIETFIDYDVPTHRMLLWANDMGLVMFTKFFLRIQRVIFKILRTNPGRAASGILMQSLLEDISDPLDSGLIDTNLADKFVPNGASELLSELVTPSGGEIAWDSIKWMIK